MNTFIHIYTSKYRSIMIRVKRPMWRIISLALFYNCYGYLTVVERDAHPKNEMLQEYRVVIIAGAAAALFAC